MSVTETTAYACAMCGKLFSDEQDAMECCPPEEIEAFECDKCGELYEDEDEATKCWVCKQNRKRKK